MILDTDIGGDIDDTWALAMLLRSPELDVQLITTATEDTEYRARIVARMLEVAGRTDIPIGIGLRFPGGTRPQAAWVEGYDLGRYPGLVYQDGVPALVEAIVHSPDPVTLISIAPLPNVSAALLREPRIALRARFVGMQGSIRRGYGGSPRVSAEYNVATHTSDCQRVFAAPWDMTITPVDTCGIVRLVGDKYRTVRQCQDPLVQALLQNYRLWASNVSGYGYDSEVESSVLYDTVAIYLAFSEHLLSMERLGIRITDVVRRADTA